MTVARFPIISAGEMVLPAKCHSCGSCDQKRQYIDLTLQVEFYGSVYLCTFCFGSVAADIEYVPALEVELAASHLTDQCASNAKLDAENKALRYALATLLLDNHSSGSDVNDLVDRIVSSVSEAQQRAEADSGTSVHTEGPSTPSSGKGSKRVRNAATNSDTGTDLGIEQPEEPDAGTDSADGS
jgi:hypothetical protein